MRLCNSKCTSRQLSIFAGPVKLLTNPSSAGYTQNPISVYYCYTPDMALQRCIAEVTNTPWGERVTFVFDPTGATVAKALHVSPMMDMQNKWCALHLYAQVHPASSSNTCVAVAQVPSWPCRKQQSTTKGIISPTAVRAALQSVAPCCKLLNFIDGVCRHLQADDPLQPGECVLQVNASHPELGDYFRASLTMTASPEPHTPNELASWPLARR